MLEKNKKSVRYHGSVSNLDSHLTAINKKFACPSGHNLADHAMLLIQSKHTKKEQENIRIIRSAWAESEKKMQNRNIQSNAARPLMKRGHSETNNAPSAKPNTVKSVKCIPENTPSAVIKRDDVSFTTQFKLLFTREFRGLYRLGTRKKRRFFGNISKLLV